MDFCKQGFFSPEVISFLKRSVASARSAVLEQSPWTVLYGARKLGRKAEHQHLLIVGTISSWIGMANAPELSNAPDVSNGFPHESYYF